VLPEDSAAAEPPTRRMRPSVARRRRLILLGVNLIAVAVFSFPVYGFIGYMDLNGVAKFVGTAWAGIGLTAAFVWPPASSATPLRAYLLLLFAAYAASVLAYGLALHKLYAEPSLYALYKWLEHSLAIGGLFTVGYWLPASLINLAVLRRRAA
jgi:hypothetical protein